MIFDDDVPKSEGDDVPKSEANVPVCCYDEPKLCDDPPKSEGDDVPKSEDNVPKSDDQDPVQYSAADDTNRSANPIISQVLMPMIICTMMMHARGR